MNDVFEKFDVPLLVQDKIYLHLHQSRMKDVIQEIKNLHCVAIDRWRLDRDLKPFGIQNCACMKHTHGSDDNEFHYIHCFIPIIQYHYN